MKLVGTTIRVTALSGLIFPIAMFAGSCGKDSAPKKPGSSGLPESSVVVETEELNGQAAEVSDDEGGEDVVDDDGVTTMVEGFQLTMVPFLAETSRCSSCHGASQAPLFGQKDVKKAFDEVFNNRKVDFISIEASRLVQRLNENHYCWSGKCEDDAPAMAAKITEWRDMVDDGSIEALREAAEKYSTPGALLSAAANVDNPDIVENPTRLIMEAEDPTTTLTGIAATDDPKGSGGKVLVMLAANNRAVINFNVTVAGTYFVYGLTSNAAANQTTMNANFDNGANTLWQAPVTGANLWQWSKVATAAGVPLSATLAAGAHTLTLTATQAQFKIDAIAITTQADFVGGSVLPKKVNVLSFDLTQAKGSKVPAGTKLEIQVLDFDENSYKFKSPILRVASGTVKIKGLKILLNGTWSSTNATYMPLDLSVSAPGKVLSEAAMIVPKDKGPGEDQISVQFEVLE